MNKKDLALRIISEKTFEKADVLNVNRKDGKYEEDCINI